VGNSPKTPRDEVDDGGRRAAQYVRMSTEHQKYSTENQSDAIAQYAHKHGLTVVKTYEDAGKSGLRLDGRDALKRLIDDVTNGRANFSVVLVYDVSRWGRFQDADQSAYYEYVCKEAGVTIQYCAEQFENDGSLSATIIKSMKRAMAGEYSRELSAKVFAGQCRLIKLGFRQGGVAGYGLRRQLVDEHKTPKAQLARGEHKSLQTDRVILVPGPAEEVDTVRRIYRLFVVQLKSEAEIAVMLNAEAISTDLGRPWTRALVHQILINEKYAGDNVYNRISFKLKQKRVVNPPDRLVRCEAAFEPLIPRELFDAAQSIILARSRRYSDDEMLQLLDTVLRAHGRLSALVIDESEDLPSSSAYRHRFGSLVRAYRLVGYDPGRDFSYLETNRALRAMYPKIIAETIAAIESVGGTARLDVDTDMLHVNEELTLSIVIARSTRTQAGALRWKIRLDAGLMPDITLALRMDDRNEGVLDYYILPSIDALVAHGPLRLREENGVSLDAYRCDTLEPFAHLTRRANIRRAA
jgi:DNA invertase Pin-like site-specific DNA recombinase